VLRPAREPRIGRGDVAHQRLHRFAPHGARFGADAARGVAPVFHIVDRRADRLSRRAIILLLRHGRTKMRAA
jgi:hypothetical protein